ncbi:MAG: glycosyltransferase [Candidatus Acidiferrales bacterium]
MKILIVHNAYQQLGGEDTVVAAEAQQLGASGHTVLRYSRHNDELDGSTLLRSLKAGCETIWSSRSYHDFERLLAQEKPGVAHFHNTFPLISPSAYYACAKAGVPVVQTLHNYRLLCPSATFLRDGAVCELCLGRSMPWPGVLHACYRSSRAATATVAAMLAAHRAMKTWQTKVDVYIALSEFARRKFVEGGLPPERIVVKPNFVRTDPGSRCGRGEYALFVGRCSSEKGVNVLAEAWAALSNPISLQIVGDGPLLKEVETRLHQNACVSVTMPGRLSPGDVSSSMRSARFLVVPSICYENFPLVVAEAYACGVPVIASRLGALAEIVHDGRTGLHFTPGDPIDLAAKAQWAWDHPEEMKTMGRAARAEYEAKYTAERNCKLLLDIYDGVLAGHQSGRSLSEPSGIHVRETA